MMNDDDDKLIAVIDHEEYSSSSSSSIALLQERFRQLQRVKDMRRRRQGRELLIRKLSMLDMTNASSNFIINISDHPSKYFFNITSSDHDKLLLMMNPTPTPPPPSSSWSSSCQVVSLSLWPNNSQIFMNNSAKPWPPPAAAPQYHQYHQYRNPFIASTRACSTTTTFHVSDYCHDHDDVDTSLRL